MARVSSQGKLRWVVGLLVIGLVASVYASAVVARTAELGAGCDLFASQKSVVQQADVAVGDLVKVTLCSNPTTGFSWHEPAISDAVVIGLVDETFAAAPAGETGPVVGAAGTDSFTLKATARGISTLVLKYSQPWTGGSSSEWTYTLTVTVR